MMSLASAALPVCAVAVALVGSVLWLQLLLACWPRRERPADAPAADEPRPAIAVLVPAHNEERGLARTLAGVSAQLRAGDRLLVVAHNCTDGTEAVARSLGAEAVACRDAGRAGKGYALEAGYRHLAESGPRELAVIVDADCELGAGALDRLAQTYRRSGTAVQARYAMRNDGAASARSRLAAFAWLVRNDIRPKGYARLGLGCQLMGTGMAIPFAALDPGDLATGHLAEDLVLGARLALAGYPPAFCESAVVVSDATPTDSGRQAQRTRWIHGHLLAIRQYAPALILAGIRRRDVNLIAMGADRLVPPLTLLVAIQLAMLAAAGIAFAASGLTLPLAIAGATAALTFLSLGAAWRVHGREVIGLADLASLPVHALAIGRIVTRFARGERSRWNRSERL
jgi:cellulose synthase/poly-beta-1,6-N-acetylglucosamine synthase-like glycosyltransferase